MPRHGISRAMRRYDLCMTKRSSNGHHKHTPPARIQDAHAWSAYCTSTYLSQNEITTRRSPRCSEGASILLFLQVFVRQGGADATPAGNIRLHPGQAAVTKLGRLLVGACSDLGRLFALLHASQHSHWIAMRNCSWLTAAVNGQPYCTGIAVQSCLIWLPFRSIQRTP